LPSARFGTTIQAAQWHISPIIPYPDGQFRSSSIAAWFEISKIPREQAFPAIAPVPVLDGCRIGPSWHVSGMCCGAYRSRFAVGRANGKPRDKNSLPALRAPHLTPLFRFAFFENSTHCPRTDEQDLWTTMNRRTRVNHVYEKAKRRV
jgi:hypothetical protein